MQRDLASLITLAVAALVACGGAQPAPPSNPAPKPEAEASATPPAGTAEPSAPSAEAGAPPPASETPTFASLPIEKNVEIMTTVVVPKVGAPFKEHDGKKFAKFSCATCHGPQKKDDPHEVLPKLTLSNGGFEKLAKAKPAVMKLLSERVVPEMAAALGDEPFDPATNRGFGCGGCHAVD